MQTVTEKANPFKEKTNKKFRETKGVDLKINLKPADQSLNQTATELRHIGPEIISPNFSGTGGLSPQGE